MIVGLVLVLFVRPDPKRIAEALAIGTPDAELRPAAPLKEILLRPGVIPSVLAAQASFGVMVGVMTLTGAVVVDHHHHSGEAVFPIIGAHVLGMYALVLFVGDLIDRIGRPPALVGGLAIMALSSIEPPLDRERARARRSRSSASGSGWNLSFVAATAQLADCTLPWERGKLLGFNDLSPG